MSSDESIPDLLLIGAITADIDLNGNRVPGGTVFYSAITAARLGMKVGIVTRPRNDISFDDLPGGIQVTWAQPASSLCFRNIYQAGERVQYIQHRESGVLPLGAKDIPPQCTKVPMVHLAPVANDVEIFLASLFTASTVLATPQGWLRTWDNVGRVMFMPRRWGQNDLQNIELVVLSDEDLHGDQEQLDLFIRNIPVVVMTTGRKGCLLYSQDSCHEVPAFPTTAVDPTGAGDSFATAFLIHYFFSHDPMEAAIFANCVASFAVEGLGTSSIPTLHDVEQRLKQNGFEHVSTRLPKTTQPT